MKKIIYILLIAAIFASCNQGDSKAKEQMEKNKATAQAFSDEVINKHNPAMVDSLCSSDFVERTPDPSQKADREGLKKSMADVISGYPDIHVKTNFVIADSNSVVEHYTMTGTNTGPMMGMPPTNKKLNVDGVNIMKFKDGKCTEHWGYMEEIKFMTQMGMMPDMSTTMPSDSSKKKMDDHKMEKKK